jgi:acetyl-CoA synthetase
VLLAFIELVAGVAPDRQTALAIFCHARARLSPYKRIRRIEFAPLPKTISGKIRRAVLRQGEQHRATGAARGSYEFWEEDFPELR